MRANNKRGVRAAPLQGAARTPFRISSFLCPLSKNLHDPSPVPRGECAFRNLPPRGKQPQTLPPKRGYTLIISQASSSSAAMPNTAVIATLIGETGAFPAVFPEMPLTKKLYAFFL